MPPTPTWTAAPSGTRAATCRPTARSTWPPVAAARELRDDVEVAHGDELHAPAPPRVLQPRRHVPRGRAQRRVLRPRVGKITEVDAAEQREVAQPLGLRADLREQRDGLAAGGRHEDLHAGAEPLDGGAR